MKTTFNKILMIIACMTSHNTLNAQRYVNEIFSNVSITYDVTYAQNYSFFPDPGNSFLMPLKFDFYEPAGDVLPARPLVIILHTGSYFPKCANNFPTGSKNDSATVEICTQLARRGFVVANIDYRLGWNPASSNQDVRRGTLFQAVYRSIQDAKSAVRFFRNDFVSNNIYKVDTSMIILGGQGTGGIIALNYISLDKISELQHPKFISGTTDSFYGFIAGHPYINQDTVGDFEGFGGHPMFNYGNNNPGFSSDVAFVFNLSGALGDSTWIEPGDKPIVSFHVLNDPSVPFGAGIIYVPGNPPMAVVDVAGSGLVSQYANQYGNNCFTLNMGSPSDPFTLAANANNNGNEGLFPFVMTPAAQSGPWEWWDSASVVNNCNLQIHLNGLVYNPNMSKQKALAYIDTVMNYLCPRIVAAYPCVTGLEESTTQPLHVYPNPASSIVTIEYTNVTSPIKELMVFDSMGKKMRCITVPGMNKVKLDLTGLNEGIYILKIITDKEQLLKKLILLN